jgi:hypothetical protein
MQVNAKSDRKGSEGGIRGLGVSIALIRFSRYARMVAQKSIHIDQLKDIFG